MYEVSLRNKSNLALKVLLFILAITIVAVTTFERDKGKVRSSSDCEGIFHDYYKKSCLKKLVQLKERECLSIENTPIYSDCQEGLALVQKTYEEQSGSVLILIVEVIPLIFLCFWVAGVVSLSDRFFLFLRKKSEWEIFDRPIVYGIGRILVFILIAWLYELLLYSFVWNNS